MPGTTHGLILAAGLIATACGGSDEPAPRSGSTAAVQGTWAACRTLVSDERETLVFSGSNVTVSTQGYASTDGSCTGMGAIGNVSGTTFSLGADVTATLGTGSVTARQLTLNFDPTAEYNIVYVNAGATPALLYLGDLTATRGLDGTAPDRRPTVLDQTAYRKQ